MTCPPRDIAKEHKNPGFLNCQAVDIMGEAVKLIPAGDTTR